MDSYKPKTTHRSSLQSARSFPLFHRGSSTPPLLFCGEICSCVAFLLSQVTSSTSKQNTHSQNWETKFTSPGTQFNPVQNCNTMKHLTAGREGSNPTQPVKQKLNSHKVKKKNPTNKNTPTSPCPLIKPQTKTQPIFSDRLEMPHKWGFPSFLLCLPSPAEIQRTGATAPSHRHFRKPFSAPPPQRPGFEAVDLFGATAEMLTGAPEA